MADDRFLTKEGYREPLIMNHVYSFIELSCKDVNEILQLHDKSTSKELLENR